MEWQRPAPTKHISKTGLIFNQYQEHRKPPIVTDVSAVRETQSTDRLNEHRLSDQKAASQPEPHATTDKTLTSPCDHSASATSA